MAGTLATKMGSKKYGCSYVAYVYCVYECVYIHIYYDITLYGFMLCDIVFSAFIILHYIAFQT